jgi:hypothetical protein
MKRLQAMLFRTVVASAFVVQAAASLADEGQTQGWTSSPMAFVTVWRLSPMTAPVIGPGESAFVSPTAPAPNRPEEVEALLPGTAPQVARSPGIILKQGTWSTISFEGSTDTFAGLIDESTAVTQLQLAIQVDGKTLPAITVPLRSDVSGAGLVKAGASDGSCYAVSAAVTLFPRAGN